MVELLGGTNSRLTKGVKNPTVLMLSGLQGAGKTTFAAKLANYLKKQGESVLMVGADIYRPAAIKQLQVLGEQINVPVYAEEETKDAVAICERGLEKAKELKSTYMIIDTAGIRRKSKVEESLEYYSVLRAIKTIKRADVCILMLDGKEGLTEQDKRIAGIAAEELKPIVVVVNKWDLVDKNKVTMKSMREELYAELPFLSYAPIEFVSALTGQRTTKILEISDTIYEEYTKRISTGLLNTVLKEAVLMNNPPTRKGRVVKINYATQVSVAPPRFVLFCNYPELIHFSYARYIENKFRESFGFEGSPILISFEKKNAEKE